MALVVIPARFASKRLPGKPLLPIFGGEPMIAHVVHAALTATSVQHVLVATDHAAIAHAAKAAGAQAVMTDSTLTTGTDRVAAALRLHADAVAADVVINVQGDEPLVQPAAIDLVAHLLLTQPTADIATISTPLPLDALLDASKVKVVCGPALPVPGQAADDTCAPVRRALFFSRAPIGLDRAALSGLLRRPCAEGGSGRGGRSDAPTNACAARQHVGLYAFRPDALQRFVELPPSSLEVIEQLEQMRALEAGMRILVGEVNHAGCGVDTREDYEILQRNYHPRRGSVLINTTKRCTEPYS